MRSDQNATQRPFRFFDNREKYLLFVTTCGEKWAIAERIWREVEYLTPRPPALRLFDAGTGDGTVLAAVLRYLHAHSPAVPLLAVGKEISLEDVRLTLDKLPSRLAEHPQTVVVITNLHYTEAPALCPAGAGKQADLLWREVALQGTTAHELATRINELRPILEEGWVVRTSSVSGNPLYVKPAVLILYRNDQRFALDAVIPRRGEFDGAYDLVIAAQPYRARASVATKVRTVLDPLARALAPGGRMIAIQGTGQDPGMEIIRKVWPGEDPFRTPAPTLLRSLLAGLDDGSGSGPSFVSESERHALIRYGLRVMSTEVKEHIGTSTLLAAWNAAVYVAQIDDAKVAEAMSSGAYLEATREVLARHGGLWFIDESFVVTRLPGLTAAASMA